MDLNGRPVQLSADTPPDVPTLVIVPAESFYEDGAPYASDMKKPSGGSQAMISYQMLPPPPGDGGGGPIGDVLPPNATHQRGIGIEEYMSHVRAFNDHEPWWKDDAEFTIMLTGTDDTDSNAELTTVINIPPSVWTNSDGWKELPAAIKVGLWDRDYGTRVHIKCIERDGGGKYTFTAKGETKFGATSVSFEAGYEFSDGDDGCGEYYITLRLSDGQWTRIPDGTNPVYDGTSDLWWYGYGLPLGI